jgi:CheY-specific phosphatase CheX
MFVGNVGQLKKLITQETQVFIFAVFGIFILLLYLSHFPIISDLITTIISILPFIIIFSYIIFFYIKSKHDPEIFHMLEKYYLVSLLEILFSILILFIIFFPNAWKPVFDFVFSIKNFISLDNYFLLASYIGIAIVCSSIIFFFIRVYQKSQNQYNLPISQLFKKTLYSTFLMMLFLMGFSVLAYPQAYYPITDAISDVIYSISFEQIAIPKFSGSELIGQKKSILKITTDALTQTKNNLTQNISDTNSKLATSVSDVKNNLTASITSTSDTLSTNIDKKFDAEGGTISGDTKVQGEMQTEDVVPQSGNTYDLGSVSKGWNNAYIHRLYGASPITVGGGSSSHSLTDNDDFIISGDLEVNGMAYLDGGLTLSGSIVTSGNESVTGTFTADNTSVTHKIGNLSILNGALTGITSLNTTVSSTELSYLDGATSNIQTQLDAKVGTTGNQTMTGNLDISRINARNSSGLKLYDDGGNGIFIKNGGNVGIGTADPTGKFQVGKIGFISAPTNVSATPNTDGSDDYYVDGTYDYYTGWVCTNTTGIQVYAYKTDSEGLKVYSAAASASTTSPSCDGATYYHVDYSWDAVAGAEGYKVLIQDDYWGRGYADSSYDFVGVNNTSFTEGNNGSGSFLTWDDDVTVTPNATQGFVVTADGWVGIGTASPVSALDMNGSSISLNGGWLSGDGENEGIYVSSAGLVGIGTSSPSTALDVVGSLTVSGGLNLSSLQVTGQTASVGQSAGNMSIASGGGGDGNNSYGGGNGGGLIFTAGNGGTGGTSMWGSPAGLGGDISIIAGDGGTASDCGICDLDGVRGGNVTITAGRRGNSRGGGNTAPSGNVVINPGIDGAIYLANNTGSVSVGGNIEITSGKNLSLASGTGTFTQTYTGTGTAATITANSLTSGNILSLTSTSTAATAGNTGLNIAISGANATNAITRYGLKSAVTATNATSGTNIAGYFSASGATTANYGLLVAAGNVGIGITTPTALLHLVGADANNNNGFQLDSNESTGTNSIFLLTSDVVSGDDPVFRVLADGTVTADGTITPGGADYAEYFYTKDMDLASGEAVCVDKQKENAVKRCANTGDNDIMGIVSSKPSIVGNNADGREKDKNYKIVGMMGQVSGKITNENGPIQIGDSLTSAIKPGYMRKADAGESTVGIALQNFDQNDGTIQILISRRNKSLTVEKVEEEVTKNIADMNVKEKVDKMVANAQTQLDESIKTKFSDQDTAISNINSKILNLEKILQDQIDELKKQTNQDLNLVQLELNTANIESNTQDISLIKQILGITETTEGNISILGTLTAEKVVVDGIETGQITIKVKKAGEETIGTGTIIAGETKTIIETKAISVDSKVFVTPLTEKPVLWSVSEKKKGESFTITLDVVNTEDIKFDWWIVGSK